MNNESIRIGVVGELGIGKSELVHQICHRNTRAAGAASDLAGPTVDVLDFERPNSRGNIWVEFVVLPSETRHQRSRQMLYSFGLDALFLVCSCSSPRSFLRATEWIEEAASTENILSVPVALILGGPQYIHWQSSSTLAKLVEPLAERCSAEILDLSGYTSAAAMEPKQRHLLSEFYEKIYRSKNSKGCGLGISHLR
ncbi:Rab-like protein 3 [Coemansia sp. RSA 1813]|nr:Rab-like protein 3 [Coemansia sp. RSA 1843]KAJ2217035.1 Rab-like protein 3 [Coemansia sp. RSA 487]KAJ2566550.1 Rab-like protein 3 [Coemansia sp. RSA 1813]